MSSRADVGNQLHKVKNKTVSSKFQACAQGLFLRLQLGLVSKPADPTGSGTSESGSLAGVFSVSETGIILKVTHVVPGCSLGRGAYTQLHSSCSKNRTEAIKEEMSDFLNGEGELGFLALVPNRRKTPNVPSAVAECPSVVRNYLQPLVNCRMETTVF